jgi:arginase
MTTFEGYRPLVLDADVVVLGFRDAEEAETYGCQVLPPEMRAIDLTELRRSGVDTIARDVIDRLSRPWLNGFWIHLDADVLDDDVMPAVDYRLPGGLSWQELHAVLRAALSSPRAVGFEVTIFNPALDHGGTIAHSLIDALVRSFTV